MKIAFSEFAPDYGNYVFPYHVWGFLESGESVSDAYAQGFLPNSYDLSRFYLTRSIRVDLRNFSQTGRTRYVERKCSHISTSLTGRSGFKFSPEWQNLTDEYFAAQKVSADYRRSRFLEMLESPLATHVSYFIDEATEKPVGLVPILMRDGISQYGIPVYDPGYRVLSIGNYMMASTLERLRVSGMSYCYLGSCYDLGSLYKTRFPGMEFFNGHGWTDSRDELHFLLGHQDRLHETHLLSFPRYVETYGPVQPSTLISRISSADPTKGFPGGPCGR